MGYLDDTLLRFKKEWESSSPYITAHTSGSTGKPKEINLPKADMEVSARATCRRFGIGPDSVLWCPLSLDYIAGKMMAIRAIISGARIILSEPHREPTIPDCPISLAAIVPSQLQAISRAENIENVIIGGAPMTFAQEQIAASAKFRSYATYGMTETCSHVALRALSPVVSDYYEAMPGITFAVDSRSCLVIHAPGYSFGYLVTNDVVSLQGPAPATSFRWLGRADCVIITGGLKVHPEEVESKLRPYLPDIDFAISSFPSERWGSEVMLASSVQIDQEALLAATKSILKPHELPRHFITLKSIPRTPNGKIARRQLTEICQKKAQQ